MKKNKLTHRLLLGAASVIALPLAAQTTLTIATVDNNDMHRMQALSSEFMDQNPDITLNWVTLSENDLRQRVATDIATSGGQFDIMTIGTYEVPIWAERGWMTPLNNLSADYDVDDIMPTIREGLSLGDTLYAVPFYAESSFTMYRRDLFKQANLVMPAQPTWDFIKEAVVELAHNTNVENPICLRGKAGWGENMALVTAMVNSYGGRWFDLEWTPQVSSDAWSRAVTDYVSLLSDFGPGDSSELGYNENLALFAEGKCGIWIDATVAASTLTDPSQSTVANDIGFAFAPGENSGKRANWLWSWALAVSATSENQDAAQSFVTWATSRDYAALVAENYGWANVPPGTRQSLYSNPDYKNAAPFAELVAESIRAADPRNPTVDPVPYTGIQYVATPEFTGIGTAVGSQIAKAVAGDISVEKALENGQWVTEKIISRTQFIEK